MSSSIPYPSPKADNDRDKFELRPIRRQAGSRQQAAGQQAAGRPADHPFHHSTLPFQGGPANGWYRFTMIIH